MEIKLLGLQEESWEALESICAHVKDMVKKHLFSTDLDSVWKAKTESMNLLRVCMRKALPINYSWPEV